MVSAAVCRVLEKYRPAISRNEKQIADYPSTARTRKERSLLTKECEESKIGKAEIEALYLNGSVTGLHMRQTLHLKRLKNIEKKKKEKRKKEKKEKKRREKEKRKKRKRSLSLSHVRLFSII